MEGRGARKEQYDNAEPSNRKKYNNEENGGEDKATDSDKNTHSRCSNYSNYISHNKDGSTGHTTPREGLGRWQPPHPLPFHRTTAGGPDRGGWHGSVGCNSCRWGCAAGRHRRGWLTCRRATWRSAT